MGFGACGVEPFGFFSGWGSLYIHRKTTQGKNMHAVLESKAFMFLVEYTPLESTCPLQYFFLKSDVGVCCPLSPILLSV